MCVCFFFVHFRESFVLCIYYKFSGYWMTSSHYFLLLLLFLYSCMWFVWTDLRACHVSFFPIKDNKVESHRVVIIITSIQHTTIYTNNNSNNSNNDQMKYLLFNISILSTLNLSSCSLSYAPTESNSTNRRIREKKTSAKRNKCSLWMTYNNSILVHIGSGCGSGR